MTKRTKKKSRRGITDVQKQELVVFCGKVWCSIEFRIDGVLRIEDFSGLTRHEANKKADARISELVG